MNNDDLPADQTYTKRELQKLPGAIYKDLHLYDATGKRIRKGEEVRSNKKWDKLRKNWKKNHRCTKVNSKLRFQFIISTYNSKYDSIVSLCHQPQAHRRKYGMQHAGASKATHVRSCVDNIRHLTRSASYRERQIGD
jgi:hypothetical protein